MIPDTAKHAANKLRWRARDLHASLDPSDLLDGRSDEFVAEVALELNGMIDNCRSDFLLIRLREAFQLVGGRT